MNICITVTTEDASNKWVEKVWCVCVWVRERERERYSLCFISWTARQGQLEHIRENMRTTMINIPELSTGGVTTSSCWMLVNRSRDATSWRRFCWHTHTCTLADELANGGHNTEHTETANTVWSLKNYLRYKPPHVESCPPVWRNRDKCFLRISYPERVKWI